MKSMKKIIAFSLWGDNPKYTIGAVRNAELTPIVYPGWTARFYIGESVPEEIVQRLKDLSSEVIMMSEPGNWTGMFWRFHPAGEPDVDIMLSRDTDSRLNAREKAAVDEWLASDKAFHIMRDHPAHGVPILGGMWGARNGILNNIKTLIDEYKKGDFWQVDQNFLREKVYPIVRNTSMVHDEFFEKKSFPIPRLDTEFVGDVFDERNQRHPEYWKDIAKFLKR